MSAADEISIDFTRIKEKPFGTRFFKADLHYHTPASTDARGSDKYGFNPYKRKYPAKTDKKKTDYDYTAAVRDFQYEILKESRVKAREIVWRFCQQGLSLVAVTDHNGIGTIWSDEDGRMDLAAPTWYELIDAAARKINTGLTILPGVEISTVGVHILAVFPPQDPLRKAHFIICDLLDEVGIGPDDWGQNPKVGHASVIDTVKLIIKKGGLAIPAHIDGSDQAVLELYEVNSPTMREMLQYEHLRAVEVVDPGSLNTKIKGETITLTRKAWIGKARRDAGLPSVAYFQGSDAHDLRTIGKRFTYLKMTQPSFSGLQTAMKMASSRVRIKDSKKEWNGLYIRSMVCDHPFLGKKTLRFNRNLNSISGKMGTGKTTLFGLMQAAVYPDYPQRDQEGKIKADQNGYPVTLMGYEKDETENLKKDGKGAPIPCKGSVTLFVDLVKQVPEELARQEDWVTDLDLLASANLVKLQKDNKQVTVLETKLVSDEKLLELIKQLGEYRESVSEHYAFHREAGQESVEVFCVETDTETPRVTKLAEIKLQEKPGEQNGVAYNFEPSTHEGSGMKKFISTLQPRFYDNNGMDNIIYDRSGKKLQEFVCKMFDLSVGAPSPDQRLKNEENIAEFNDLFFIPRFLEAEKQTELARTKADRERLAEELAMIEAELNSRKDSLPEPEKIWLNDQKKIKKAELAGKIDLIEKLEKDQFQLEKEDFKQKKTDQLLQLTLTAENTLRLEMNINWRQDATSPYLVDFLRLTPSQRKIAIMCMILVKGQLPVIIDSPEEEFDNGDMAKYLLPLILEYKETRQILLFTNHPLLAVNTDPDNYLVLHMQDAAEDGAKPEILINSGFAIDVQGSDRALLINVLEGDLGAFRKRISRYE